MRIAKAKQEGRFFLLHSKLYKVDLSARKGNGNIALKGDIALYGPWSS